MTDHRMHPSAEIFGEHYARDTYVEVSHFPPIPPVGIGVFITIRDHDEDATLTVEIPKATFDKFIAEYLSAHGETWIG